MINLTMIIMITITCHSCSLHSSSIQPVSNLFMPIDWVSTKPLWTVAEPPENRPDA